MKKKVLKGFSSALAVCMAMSNYTVLADNINIENDTDIISQVDITNIDDSEINGVIIRVGKGSEYDFNNIQDAIDSINFTPTENNRAIISIAKGLYEEVVNINKPYVSLVNADTTNPDDVIITFDRAASHENPEKKFGTQQSATVTAEKDAIGFKAENITIQNSYNLNQPNLGDDSGREQTQAVALVTITDKVELIGCKFLGRQDTLYLKGSSKGTDVYGQVNNARVYVKDCFIEGTVDYIFGDAVAYFDNCELNMAYYKNGGHYTASNTTLFNIGYVFNNCKLTADEKYNNFTGDNAKNIDLGRPWQGDSSYPNYGSQSVFINCSMPDVLSKAGFSAWNNSTITNKIRYYEYGSTDESGQPLDMSKRIDWEKILTPQQAMAYNVYNVLSGDDGWNPSNAKVEKAQVCDVTLDKYSLEIPKNEKGQIKAFVMPIIAENNAIIFSSSDESIATVNSDGVITAVGEGQAKITATTVENGFNVSCDVTVLPSRTAVPSLKNIYIKSDGKILPNTTLTGTYEYINPEDKKIDCAKVKWYVIDKDGNKTLVQEGRDDTAKKYTIKGADIGSIIRFSVIPESLTSYGDRGLESSEYSLEVAKPNDYNGKTYIRDGFEKFSEKYAEKGSETKDTVWIASGGQASSPDIKNAVTVDIDGNTTVGGGTTDLTRLEYNPKENETPWENISLETRMIFNPISGGFSSNCYYNILTNYNKETGSYYKLSIIRGGNTNSLKLYLYKNNGNGTEDILLASDEESLKDKVPQNKGQDNPWFKIKQVNKNGKITVQFTLEGDEKPLATLSAEDNEPIENGFIAFESFGKVAVLLNDFVFCEKA